MQTIEQILKKNQSIKIDTEEQKTEIIDVCDKLNANSIQGTFSVRIGYAYVYVPENDKEDAIYDTIQYTDIYLHLGDAKGSLYATQTKNIDMTCYGGIKSGRYVNKENLVSIQLFNNAYERIRNKMIEKQNYHCKQYKTNKEQLKKIASL